MDIYPENDFLTDFVDNSYIMSCGGKGHQAIFINKETVFPGNMNIRTLDASPLIPSGFREILLFIYFFKKNNTPWTRNRERISSTFKLDFKKIKIKNIRNRLVTKQEAADCALPYPKNIHPEHKSRKREKWRKCKLPSRATVPKQSRQHNTAQRIKKKKSSPEVVQVEKRKTGNGPQLDSGIKRKNRPECRQQVRRGGRVARNIPHTPPPPPRTPHSASNRMQKTPTHTHPSEGEFPPLRRFPGGHWGGGGGCLLRKAAE